MSDVNISMVVKMCAVSGVPVDKSRYQKLCRMLGLDVLANKAVYEIEVPPWISLNGSSEQPRT